MDSAQIEKWAAESVGLEQWPAGTELCFSRAALTRFAELVAAAERERILAPQKSYSHTVVCYCPKKDAECGMFERNWCAICPKRTAIRNNASRSGG